MEEKVIDLQTSETTGGGILNKKKNSGSKKTLIIIEIIAVIGTIAGISYAYWISTQTQTGINKVNAGCLNLEMTNEKNDINLAKAYPIEDSDGKKLTPYAFTITNTCNLFASYTVSLEMLEGTDLASKYVKVMVNNEEIKNLGSLETTDTILDNSKEARILTSGSLGAEDSEDYSIRLWMDGDTTTADTDSMNKQLLSKVVVHAVPSHYSPVENGFTLLKDAILVNEYQTTSVEVAKNRIAAKQEVDFTKTAPIIDWEESHASNTTTINTTLPDPSLVGSGIPGTEKLTATNVLPLIGTGYTFNRETGMYTLTGVQYVDPTTLDYSSKDYYYIYVTVRVDESGTLTFYRPDTESYLYKITSATASEGTITTQNGSSYKAVVYKMTGYKHTQSEVESDKSDKGLYQINDADGTSYYYRGSVNNNYVYFADAYWKIIRINGDGSIRLLYSGTKPNATGNDLFSTLTDTSLGFNNIKTTAFNIKRDNPAYVGYMYGNTLNTSYEQTHANENDSNIKKYLDSWYTQNIEDKGLSKYIADSGFCNDRSLSSGNGFSINQSSSFAARVRVTGYKTPDLSCNTNDLFTVSNSKGNRALQYAVGLINSDELMLSGYAYEKMNSLVYTYSSSWYWSMSPSFFYLEADTAQMIGVGTSRPNIGLKVTDSLGVRPVINLKADAEITGGIGTSNEPFVIK